MKWERAFSSALGRDPLQPCPSRCLSRRYAGGLRHDGTLKFDIGGFFGWLDPQGNEVSGVPARATVGESDDETPNVEPGGWEDVSRDVMGHQQTMR